MLAQPCRQMRLGCRAVGDCQHDHGGIGLVGDDAEAVQAGEDQGADEGDALVAVVERVVLGQGDAVPGGEFEDVGDTLVGVDILRAGQGAFEQAFVTQDVERLNVTLPMEMARVIRSKVESGLYASNSEVVREAMRSWMEAEARRGERLDVIRAKIAEADADPRRWLSNDEVAAHLERRGR